MESRRGTRTPAPGGAGTAVALEVGCYGTVAKLEAAPTDDEPYTEEDRSVSDEGWAAHRRGEAVGVDELRTERNAAA